MMNTLHWRICRAGFASGGEPVEDNLLSTLLQAHLVNADQVNSTLLEGQTINLSTLSGISSDHPVTFVEFQPTGKAPVGILFIFKPIPDDYGETFLTEIRRFDPELRIGDVLREAKVHVTAIFFLEENSEENPRIVANVQFPLSSDGRLLDVIGVMWCIPSITSETRGLLLYTCLRAISSQAN